MAWSDAQKKAASERTKRRLAEQRAAQEDSIQPEPYDEPPTTQPVAPLNPTPADYLELLKRVQELEQRGWTPAQPTSTKILDKYRLTGYPDPRARLKQEPRLQRFAFPVNYELEWKLEVSRYQTVEKQWFREPRFELALNRIVIDEDTGDPTNERYTICRGIFHEDPDAALIVAQENGYVVEEWAEAEFLNEMRYLRFRDWLLEAFYPPKPSQEKKNKREMVIGGKLVEVFEINSESSETIPFSQLKSKI